jgi:hypothetical protein
VKEGRVAVVDELLQLFARSIFAKAAALRSLDPKPNHRRRLRSTITAEIRACGGLLYPEVLKPEVSEAAFREAELIPVDLRAQTWHSQSRFDRGRRVFHREHVDPISCIQEACEGAESEQAVLEFLRTRLRIAWILKREDRELTRLGFQATARIPRRHTRLPGSYSSNARPQTPNQAIHLTGGTFRLSGVLGPPRAAGR